MSDVVIKVENLSKKYLIGHQSQESYTALRDVLTRSAKNFGKRLLSPFNGSTIQQFNDSTEEFYALRDVSFEIRRGDRVGIIGRNGAGKSTLLKVLSRITEPTSGRIEIDGRVASLLEVGTGFHPELTGRENIFLNGAILGMSRVDIKRKFDEIVAFAEVERFLDTPVKRYSSGMYVRLAFAVAAHLEPEILIVDEVLAVGDAQFQKKCLGKMEEVGKEGRTVLFVSHNMQAVESLCSTSIIMKAGTPSFYGPSEKALEKYLMGNCPEGDLVANVFDKPRSGGNQLAIKAAWVENSAREVVREVYVGEKIYVSYRFEADHELTNPGYGLSIDSVYGTRLATYGNYIEKREPFCPIKRGTVTFSLNRNSLLPGRYLINFGLAERWDHPVDYVQNALDITVLPRDIYGTGRVYEPSHGFFCLDVSLSIKKA